MLFTLIPLFMNTYAGMQILISDISTANKIFFIILILVKYFIYFYSFFISEMGYQKNIGLGICAILNFILIIIMCMYKIWITAIILMIILIFLMIWILSSIDFKGKGGK